MTSFKKYIFLPYSSNDSLFLYFSQFLKLNRRSIPKIQFSESYTQIDEGDLSFIQSLDGKINKIHGF